MILKQCIKSLLRLQNKIMYKQLEKEILKYSNGGICIAFSGGVDSSLLLKVTCEVAQKQNKKIYAVLFDTFLQPKNNITIAKKVAEECGAFFSILSINELENPLLQYNPKDRCYQCKKFLFGKLLDFAKQHNCQYLFDGTNEDDKSVYRPGLQAIKELGIISPLADDHITKEQVRLLAAQLGLSVANRASNSCLATRLAYGMKLEPQTLLKIEQGEIFLEQLGFRQIRLRIHGDIMRIEVAKEQMSLFAEKIEEIRNYFKDFGWKHITVDIYGFRSGTMDL